MAGRYTGSYLDRSDGWRAVAVLTDIGQALLVVRIPAGKLCLRRCDRKMASSHLASESNSYDASISTRTYRVHYPVDCPARYATVSTRLISMWL